MFKNVTIYRVAPDWDATLEAMEAALDAARFVPCGASQDQSVGWAEPRDQAHGPLVESVNGQRILKLIIETKVVPSAVMKEKTQAAVDHIEATTGRKPGKKETKSLREDALLSLLPQAFPRRQQVWVWLDLKNRLLVTDAGSQGKNDTVVTALVRAFDNLALTLLQTAVTPQTAMAQWLATTDPEIDWPVGFAVERECELKSTDEEKSAVKFTRHHLLTDEIRKHLDEGKRPTRLALSWEGRIGFTLTESMQLKRVTFLEGTFDDRPSNDDGGFDADVMLATGELSQLILALIDALGGELQPGQLNTQLPSQQTTAPATGAVQTPHKGNAPASAKAPMVLTDTSLSA